MRIAWDEMGSKRKTDEEENRGRGSRMDLGNAAPEGSPRCHALT